MKRQPWGLYAIALPIIALGLVVLGVPVQALLFAAFVLACPFIMVFVMAVMRVGNGTHDGMNQNTNDGGLYTPGRPATSSAERPSPPAVGPSPLSL
jgi:choline-glycine betaine transporter